MTTRLNKHMPRRSEHAEQSAVIDWRDAMVAQWPELKYLHAIPNGGKRDVVTAVNMKREGVTRGVPDLSWPLARHMYHGLYIEMKVHPNTPSDEQTDFLNWLSSQGYCALVCYSAEEAIEALKWYYTYDGIPF